MGRARGAAALQIVFCPRAVLLPERFRDYAFGGAVAKLSDKVKKGGSGVWGPVPMPPNAQVPDAEVKKMVELILALKK